MIQKVEKISQADRNQQSIMEKTSLIGDSLLVVRVFVVRGCMIVPVKISSIFLDISLLLISSIGFL